MLAAKTAKAATVPTLSLDAATASRGTAAIPARIIPIKWVNALPGSLMLNVIVIPPLYPSNI